MPFQITPTTHSFLTYSLPHHSSAPIYLLANVIHYLLQNYLPSTYWIQTTKGVWVFRFLTYFSNTPNRFLSEVELQKPVELGRNLLQAQPSLPSNALGYGPVALLCFHLVTIGHEKLHRSRMSFSAPMRFFTHRFTKCVLSSEVFQTELITKVSCKRIYLYRYWIVIMFKLKHSSAACYPLKLFYRENPKPSNIYLLIFKRQHRHF